MNKQISTQHVEEGLSTLYQSTMPDLAFVNRLDQQFQGQKKGTSSSLFSRRPLIRAMPNWVTVATLVFLFAMVSVVAIGPQRVWAEVLGLIRFIPGVGIAEIEQTRLLVAPVTLRQEKVEFVVESMAVTDRTVIKYSLRSLTINVPDPRESPLNARGISFHLELPDGSILYRDTSTGWTPSRASNYELESVLIFPRLPEGVMSATLVLTVDPDIVNAPIDPAGLRADLALIPATDESVVELISEPQILEGVSDTRQGIILQINKVFYTDEQIALDVSLLNAGSPWMLSWALPRNLMLDDTPYSYYWTMSDIGVDATIAYRDPQYRVDQVYVYEPGLRPDATVLSFDLEAMLVYTDAAPLPITWEMDTAVLNKTVPADIDFEIAGFPYQVVGARWMERPDYYPAVAGRFGLWWDPQDCETQYLLVVDLLTPSSWEGDLEPASLALESDHALYTTTIMQRGADGDDVCMLGFTELPEDAVTITVSKAFFLLHDEWHVEWDVVHPE